VSGGPSASRIATLLPTTPYPMWRTLHQRGLLSLAFCLACAGGLRYAPEWVGDPIRNGLRSSLAPGASAVAKVEGTLSAATSRTRDTWTGLVADAAPADHSTDDRLLSQLEAARTHIRRLEAALAEVNSRTQQAREQAALRLPIVASESLWRTGLVPARVIGRERSAVEQTAARLVQCGLRDGVAREDLVIEPALLESLEENHPAVLIDQGADAGLDRDFPVAGGQTLVGRIRAAGSLTSTVQLVTDPDFRVGAQILRATEQGPVFGGVGIYAGQGTGAGRLELIAATQPVAVGDSLYTDEHVAGESLRLYIGRISRAELNPGDPHWTIEVAPGMDTVPAEVEVITWEINPQRVLGSTQSPKADDRHEMTPVQNPEDIRSDPLLRESPGA
jgi:cell shape-determining protein MreC